MLYILHANKRQEDLAMLTTIGTTVVWVLYVLSGNAGWIPMGSSEFGTYAQCQSRLSERAEAMSALGVKPSQMNMRCKRKGWDGRELPKIGL